MAYSQRFKTKKKQCLNEKREKSVFILHASNSKHPCLSSLSIQSRLLYIMKEPSQSRQLDLYLRNKEKQVHQQVNEPERSNY